MSLYFPRGPAFDNVILIPNKQQFPLQRNPLMNFPVLPSHASMHCWKDSSRRPISFIVKDFLMAFTPSKRTLLRSP